MQFETWNSRPRLIGSESERARLVRTSLLATCIALSVMSSTTQVAAADESKSILDIRVDGMSPGAMKTFQWKRRLFVIVRTTNDMLVDLRDQTRNTWSRRSIPSDQTEFLVFAAPAEPTGCAIVHAPKGAPRYAPDREWQGGFYDPCQFGEWDYAGRSIKQYEDQEETMRRPDLEVPAFEFKDQATLRFVR